MNEELKPAACPFCAAELEPFGPDQHNHPNNDCWLATCSIKRHELAAWNRRTPVSGEVARVPAQTGTLDKVAYAQGSRLPGRATIRVELAADHAKRAEGERAAFEAWWEGWRLAEWRATLTTDELDMPMPDGWARGLMRHAWNGWQARGRQASVPEVGRPALDEFIDKVCRNDAKLISCAESAFYWFNKCLAAIPGEAK